MLILVVIGTPPPPHLFSPHTHTHTHRSTTRHHTHHHHTTRHPTRHAPRATRHAPHTTNHSTLNTQHSTTHTQQKQAFDPKLPSRLCVSFLLKTLAADDGFRCSRLWQLRSEAEKGAPAPLVAATRAELCAWPQPCTTLRSEVQGPRRTTLHGAR